MKLHIRFILELAWLISQRQAIISCSDTQPEDKSTIKPEGTRNDQKPPDSTVAAANPNTNSNSNGSIFDVPAQHLHQIKDNNLLPLGDFSQHLVINNPNYRLIKLNPNPGTKNTILPDPVKISSGIDPDLNKQIQPLNRFQLIEFVNLLVKKLRVLDHTYNFKDDLEYCIRLPSLPKNPISLNIKTEKSTNQFDLTYNPLTFTLTYKAKDGYGFRLVRDRTNVFWHTLNPKEYASRVDYDTSRNKVTVYCGRGSVKYSQFIDYKKWFNPRKRVTKSH